MKCQDCSERDGTEIFTAGGALDYSHGLFEMLCKRCVLRRQVEHAKGRAAQLPDLEKRLAEAEAQP